MAVAAAFMVCFGAQTAALALDEPVEPPAIAYARNVGETIWMIGADGGASRQLTTHRSGDPAWSPDGTRIAYTRFEGPTYDGVWLMDTDGRHQRRLTTGFTGDPAWSPDSTHLAYTSPGGIGVANADTGAHRPLLVNSDRDAAWSPDGARIMFSRFQRGVWVMDAAGTRPRQVAIEARHPVWSPGSVRIAYVNHHLEGIHVMDAHGANNRRLTTDGGVFPQWAPNGAQIAYTGKHGNEIWVIDPNGDNRRRVASVGQGPVWSPDSARIAYTRQDGIWVMDADGANPQQLTTHGKDPVWSPDGTRLLYTSNHTDGIYGIDADGGNRRQIVTGGSGPVWSPDGGQLAFTRPDGIWIMDFMDPDGQGLRRIAPEYTEKPAWSPDGARIAYTTRFGGIHLVDTNGANHQQLDPDGSDPVWSPDGTQIAYVTTKDHPPWTSGPSRAIYVMRADGADPRELTADGADPAWSPDGARIAYATRSGEIRIAGMDGRPEVLTGRFGADPTWSPDGTQIAYLGAGGGLYVMSDQGAHHRTVTLHSGLHPRWLPDGRQLAYQANGRLAVVPADGGELRFLGDFGTTPAPRPWPSQAATAALPLSMSTVSCPDLPAWSIPRFLPLWSSIGSQSPDMVSGPFEIVVEFARPVIGFRAEDITVINGRVTDFVDCGRTFRAQISPASVGAVVVRIPRNIARDLTNQGNLAPPPLVRTGVSQTPALVQGLNTWDRRAVLLRFADEFNSNPPAIGYTGHLETCMAGATSVRFREEAIERLNWYRLMAGLGQVTERSDYSELAQQAAMMMAAESRLSHNPDPLWTCHTPSGAEAARRSNLLLGAVGADAMNGYMRNQGPENQAVGHRRILLHPQLSEIGVGDVPGQGLGRSANALFIPEENLWDSQPQIREPRRFVAWPPPGYVPAETVWGRWSFSVSDADFSMASVTVANDLGEVPVEVLARDSSFAGSRNFPDPSLVWAVAGDTDSSPVAGLVDDDLCFSVSISGVRIEGSIQTPYEYATCVIGPRDWWPR